MAKVFISTSYGSDDPTRATLAMLTAEAFLEKGHEVGIVFLGEATYLLKDVILNQVKGVGWPPLSEVMFQVINGGASLYI